MLKVNTQLTLKNEGGINQRTVMKEVKREREKGNQGKEAGRAALLRLPWPVFDS